MSWFPALRIGLWNAWILMLYFPLQQLILMAAAKAAGNDDIYKKMGDAPSGKEAKKNYMIFMIVILLLIAYSIFLPLKLGTVWLYSGLGIYLAGLAILITAIINIAAAPLGQLFTKGLYRYSRHPGYFGMAAINVGAGIATASWIFLLLSVVIIAKLNSSAIAEERDCLKTYGKKYQDYMNRTPRWIGIPKSG